MSGKLIVFEGGDASGKATQSKILAEARRVPLFSFPRYDTEIGHAILGNLKGKWHCEAWDAARRSHILGPAGFERVNALVLQALMTVDRYDAAVTIEAFLAAGIDVVCDRYRDSGIVYGYVDGLEEAWLERIHAALPAPAVVIFLDVPPDVAARRRPAARDRFERDADKMLRVYHAYQTRFRTLSARGRPYRMVDGLGTIEEVAARVKFVVDAFCEAKQG